MYSYIVNSFGEMIFLFAETQLDQFLIVFPAWKIVNPDSWHQRISSASLKTKADEPRMDLQFSGLDSL